MSYSTINWNENLMNPFDNLIVDNIDIDTDNIDNKHYSYINNDSDDTIKLIKSIVINIKDFFWNTFKEVGIDSKGTLPTFFYGLKDSNAFYLRNENCIISNNNFLKPTILCHEYTHAVIHHVNPLDGFGQAGALNESLADVVAIVFARGLLGQKDWKMHIDNDENKDRDLSKCKETKSYTPLYDDKGNTTNDHGNIHYNSQFFSHAFYKLVQKLGKFKNEREVLIQIWWPAFLNLKKKTFEGFILNTVEYQKKQAAYVIAENVTAVWKNLGIRFD